MMEEHDIGIELTDDLKAILNERLWEDESTYLTAEESISLLDKKYLAKLN